MAIGTKDPMTILRLGDDYLLRLVDLGVVFFSVAVVVCKLHRIDKSRLMSGQGQSNVKEVK
jgi:hypothetical protein